MIVNKITVKNFKSYYRNNEFNFKKGLNIISGHEGAGKSNLFDAFMWVLFNHISGLDRNQILEESNVSFFNDRIKNEVFSNSSDKDILCEVKIELFVPKNNVLPHSRKYEIIRRKKIKLDKSVNGDKFFDDSVWAYEDSELIVKWKDEKFNEEEIYDQNAITELDKIFPEKIRKYIWFQGEQLNELLDFDNEETLRKAIDYISYLSAYEYMTDIIMAVDDTLTKKARNLIQAHNKDRKKFDQIISDLEYDEKKLKGLKKLTVDKDEELKTIELAQKKQKEQLMVLAGMPKLQKEEGELEGRLISLVNEVSYLNDHERKKFVNSWMLKGTESLLKDAEEELNKFIHYRLELIAENDKQLEEGMPGDLLINKMLAIRHCILCDRPAEKDSDAFFSIQSHLDSNKRLKPLDPKIEELNDKVRNLKDYPSRILMKIKDIDNSIIENQKTIQIANKNRNDTNKTLRQVKEKIKDIVREKGQGVLNMNPDNINATLLRLEEDARSITRRKPERIRTIIELENTIKQKNESLKKLKDPSIKEFVEEALIEYTDFLKKAIIAQSMEQRIELIDKIETTANEIQRNIAQINNVVIVNVKINKEDYSLSFVDDDGNPNPGHGAQNTLAKMSIINSIVQISNEMKNVGYPFIADAPTSDFGSEFTDRFLESISNTYEQSIIITKDLVIDVNKYKKLKYVNNVIVIKKESSDEIALSTNSITKIQ